MELNRRAAQRTAIQRSYDLAHSDELENMELPMVKERIRLLDANFERFNNEHMAVVENLVMPEDLAVHNDYAAEVEQLYITAMYKLKERLAALEPEPMVREPERQERPEQMNLQIGNPQPVVGGANEIRLEPIKLEKFGGEYSKWSEWRAMYDSLVHTNESLSTTQKFHYLKKSLGDDAGRVLSGWQVTGENYEQAYHTLVNVFQNGYRIIMAHLDELMKLEQSKSESVENVRKLIDTTNRVLRQLRVVGCPVEHWDHMIVYVLIARMAPRTLQAWETSQDLREMPTMADVLEFLERRSRGIINLQQNQPSGSGNQEQKNNKSNSSAQNGAKSKQQKWKSGATNENELSCHNCKQPHPMHRCSQFRNMTLNQRRDRVRELRVCFNCFKPTHSANSQSCQFGECKHCPGKRHNTLLCPKVQQQNTGSVNVVQVKSTAGANNDRNQPIQQSKQILSAGAPMFVPPNQNFQQTGANNQHP